MFKFNFHPKILDSLHDYSVALFLKDIGAGLTVAAVALPLAMAFAIASGLPPQVGLFTSIVAGVFISLFGGSKVQIGGPAGAFIVIVYGIVQHNGVSGLIIATLMSGVLLFAMGALKFGTLIRFIPVAVIIGFTNAIAVLIMMSQIKDFFGLNIAKMPADLLGIITSVFNARETWNVDAFCIALSSLIFLFIWQWWLPKQLAAEQGESQSANSAVFARALKIPGSMIVLCLCTLIVYVFNIPVQTIGTRFGGVPSLLPSPHWPNLPLDEWGDLIRPALTLAMLGSIESLLCARVADQLIDDQHNPNQELMGQGIANFISPLFGGMPATGTIARTVTNAKNGATTPIAGVVHCITLLFIVLIAAPVAVHIPLCGLSAILIFVAWNMGEWHEFIVLKEFRIPYRIILLAVFFLTIFVDLTSAVEFGLIGACVTFIYRISNLTRSEVYYDSPALQAHRLYGALFFGAVQLIENLLAHLPQQTLILDFKNLIYLDSSGTDAIQNLVKSCQKRNITLVVCGLMHQPLEMLKRAKVLDKIQTPHYPDIASAMNDHLHTN